MMFYGVFESWNKTSPAILYMETVDTQYFLTLPHVEGNTMRRIGFDWIIKEEAESWAQSSVNEHFGLTWEIT